MHSPVTRCIWIRHAPSWRPLGYVPAHDPDIVPDEAQARHLSTCLGPAHWIISPLKRCQQTAEQVKKNLTNRDDIISERFESQIVEQNLGDWAGMKLDEVWEEVKVGPRHNFSFQTADLTPPNGESFAWQYRRISSYLQALERQLERDDNTIPYVFFAHAHTIRAVIAYCMKLSLNQALSIQIGNYSRTVFDFLPAQDPTTLGGKWQLIGLNLPAKN